MRKYFIDKTGEIQLEMKDFQDAGGFSEGLSNVCDRTAFGLCGFINKAGEMAIEPTFVEARPFSEGLAIVKTEEKGFFFQPQNKWGFIDTSGNLIFESEFNRMYDYSEEIAIGEKGEEYLLIDKTGNVMPFLNRHNHQIDIWEEPKFSEGLLAVYDRNSEKCGFIDKSGKFVIEPKFESAANFSESLARVSVIKDHREYVGFINRDGEYAISPKFDIDSDFLRCATDFSEGLASLIDEPPTMERDSCFMYINKTGETVLKTGFFYANPFREGLAAVWDAETEKYGYIDKTGKLVISLEFDSAGNFSEGLALVSKY